MRRERLVLLIHCVVLFLIPCYAQAKRVSVRSLDDMKKVEAMSGSVVIVRNRIDLQGVSIQLGESCELRFRRGSLQNGTIEGNNTRLKEIKKNVFHDCEIKGTWTADCAYSTMFDSNIETMLLLRNMACLSPKIVLRANRTYHIYAKEEAIEAEVIEADGKEKPTLAFHTTDPNVCGIVIKGSNVTLRNLMVVDDYDPKNDCIYGTNKATIGNTISVIGPRNTVETLTIEGCDFRGGTSSSWVASSQTKNCLVSDCMFSGYVADHAVYCSVNVETFNVQNCYVIDVPQDKGLFKIRTSKNLRSFRINRVKAYNYSGYLAYLSLLETPDAEISFDHIEVSKDEDNSSIFYGLCIKDETESISEKYNANRITITDSQFDYGYNGSSLVYHGSGPRAYIKEINYDHVKAHESNFAGAISDFIVVNNSEFSDCCGDQGIVVFTRQLILEDSKLSTRKRRKQLFLVNYSFSQLETLAMRNVIIDAKTTTLINVVQGSHLAVHMDGCRIIKPERELFRIPSACSIDYHAEKSELTNDL